MARLEAEAEAARLVAEAETEIKAEAEAAEVARLSAEAEAAEATIEMAPTDNAWATQFAYTVQCTVPPPLDRSSRQPRGRSKATAAEVACSAAGAEQSCSTEQGPNRGPSTDPVAAAMRTAAARVAARRAAATSAEQASAEQARHGAGGVLCGSGGIAMGMPLERRRGYQQAL